MRLFGLIGYPLTHSFSKNYFTTKFEEQGIRDCAYENFQIENIADLPRIIHDHPALAGLNVTIPHKESVLPFLHASNDLVQQINACNCITITNKQLFGYNTDVIGFERSLLNKLGGQHTHALILGTGGAAKAVEFVLEKRHIEFKKVSRRPSKNSFGYEQVTADIVKEYKLIINTTPVGMFPAVHEFPPLPYDAITPEHFLFDLIYNPEETLFLKKGKEQRAVTQNGYDMLVYQAEESWRIWNQEILT